MAAGRRFFARGVTVLVVGVLAAWCASAGAADLEGRLRPLIDAHKGTVAVAVRHLETGESYGYRADEPMPTASLIKVAVMIEAYRQADAGTLDLSEPVTLRDADKVRGSGILTTHFSDGLRLSLRDAVRLMIAYSDNTATNLVLDRIGLESVARTMEAMGFPNTKIHAKVFRGETSIFPERSKKFGLGSTTASETVRLMELLHQKKAASAEACAAMLAHLEACEDRISFPRHLPAGTKVAQKTGAVTAVRTAGGIIHTPGGPVALCVLTAENADRRWADDNAGNVLCGRIARAVYDAFTPHDKDHPTEPPRELTEGTEGWLVEALQRTLNRHAPSPGLSVDGEFGPGTRAAVIAFQSAHKLPATGTVDAATWKALGPLVLEDEPLLDPSMIPEPPPKSPADALTGPPFVTCKAWAVGDPDTGTLLAGSHENERLEIASTTKLMTAYLVLREAARDPRVLDEIVTISERADRTPGSTAEVRTGERLPVKELLFGLMLPSGNDAATALSEHFGARFQPPADKPNTEDPRTRFVAEMNRAAAELGMRDTHYANPHGLSAAGHRSTPRDLFRLASVLCRDERLMAIAGTRQHVGPVEGQGGYTRYIVWKNTNHLLDIEGYLGLKTGTTTPAGACLVSLGERGPQRLAIVVLGSTSSDARYTDTRNLFRWARKQLAAPMQAAGK